MPRRNTVVIILFCLAGTLLLLGSLAGFAPQPEGPQLRRAVSPHVVTLRPEDMPLPILSRGDGVRHWAVRRTVAAGSESQSARGQNVTGQSVPEQNANIVSIENGAVRLATGGENLLFGRGVVTPLNAPLLALDGVSVPVLMGAQPGQYGDVLDARGRPLRWWLPPAMLFAGCVPSNAPRVNGKQPDAESVYTDTLVDSSSLAKARRYQRLVESFAGRYNLSTELVYAIIHSESDFSPTLVSGRSAMGLMQLLPSTASGEVHRFLYGRSGSVSFNDLREPETNIRYGTAYLHILLTRYFSEVRDPVSREYCAIAGYNMGPNRFLRLYGKTDDEAVAKINSMTSEALFVELTRTLPIRETRFYVAKVRRIKGEYAEMDWIQ